MEEAKQMPIELNKGEFYIMQGDKCISLGEGVAETEFVESEDKSRPMMYSLNGSAELSGSTVNVNQDWLNNLVAPTTPTNNFTMEYDMPIMIQARWHKKPRIRKKWLKRFGMKPDTIKVYMDVCNVCNLEYKPGRILNEQHDDSGICATFDSVEFAFEANKLEYILRPDQKRKGLKIEW